MKSQWKDCFSEKFILEKAWFCDKVPIGKRFVSNEPSILAKDCF